MRFEAENEIIRGKQSIVCNKNPKPKPKPRKSHQVGLPEHFHVTGQTNDDDIEQRRSLPFCLFFKPDLKEQLRRIWYVKTFQCNIALPNGNLKVSHIDMKMS